MLTIAARNAFAMHGLDFVTVHGRDSVTSAGKGASKRDQGPVIADATTAVPPVRFQSRIAAANESVVPEGAALGERFVNRPAQSGRVRP